MRMTVILQPSLHPGATSIITLLHKDTSPQVTDTHIDLMKLFHTLPIRPNVWLTLCSGQTSILKVSSMQLNAGFPTGGENMGGCTSPIGEGGGEGSSKFDGRGLESIHGGSMGAQENGESACFSDGGGHWF